MNERLLARLLFGVGMVTLGLLVLSDLTWSQSGAGWRAVGVVAAAAAMGGVALDVNHRREARERRPRAE